MNEGELAVWRGRTMGVVFQFFQLLPMLSVIENTILPMDFCDVYARDERVDRAMSILEMLGLAEEADELPIALSGGQQQIAAIARSLANDPPIIVADEPTGNLDSRTAENVMGIFADLVREDVTNPDVVHMYHWLLDAYAMGNDEYIEIWRKIRQIIFRAQSGE